MNPRLSAWPILLAVLLAACGGDSADEAVPAAGDPSAQPGAVVSAEETCSLPDFQSRALLAINEARATPQVCGSVGYPAAPALSWDERLFAAAAGHARDMAQNDFFSHESPDGRTFSQRVSDAGYEWSATGENLAAGQADIDQVVDAWLASPGHCANLMSDSFTEVALACVAEPESTYQQYWVMSLGRPR